MARDFEEQQARRGWDLGGCGGRSNESRESGTKALTDLHRLHRKISRNAIGAAVPSARLQNSFIPVTSSRGLNGPVAVHGFNPSLSTKLIHNDIK